MICIKSAYSMPNELIIENCAKVLIFIGIFVG
jgi:hypothetical protein